MALSPKHQRFVAEYLKDQNATQAAKRAGYSERTAYAIGSRLLKKVEIAAAVNESLVAITKRAELKREDVIEGWRRVIQADPRKIRDEKGNIRPIHELGDEEAWFLAGEETVIKNAKAGDGHTDEVLKLRYVDRAKYLEAAAKHFGMLDEVVTVNVNLDVRIRKAAERALTVGDSR